MSNHHENTLDYGTGRISEIIHALQEKHGKEILEIDLEPKINALCECLALSFVQFDALIADNSPVMRTVKGHAFESFFDLLLESNGVESIEVGGDDSIDRVVNGKSLQLKTFTQSGTKDERVQYKTHKTHGAKSERESFDYYHTFDHFADYLVGLVSYEPLRVLILTKSELPPHPLSPAHIVSPFTLNWSDHVALNAFDRLDVNSLDLSEVAATNKQLYLPRTAATLGLDEEVIVNTILNNANFRIWDMAIRGFSKEVVFIHELLSAGVLVRDPSSTGRERADKADHVVETDRGNQFLQMKGVSTNNCDFSANDPVLGVETQLTRGRVNDHPTQSRLYLVSDFEFLVIGLDPPLVKLCQHANGDSVSGKWEFYVIPTSELAAHHQMSHRLKSLQKFKYSTIQKFKVDNWTDFGSLLKQT